MGELFKPEPQVSYEFPAARERWLSGHTPAFAQRALMLDELESRMWKQCARAYESRLSGPRWRLAVVYHECGNWERLSEWLPREQLDELRRLYDVWQPRLRGSWPTNSKDLRLRLLLHQLDSSWRRFNVRWQQYVAHQDLQAINNARDQFNRYYVIEKECALRSARLACQGFRALLPLTHTDILNRFPLLPELEFLH